METENRQTEDKAAIQQSRVKRHALLAAFLTAVFFASATFFFWTAAIENRRAILASAANITATAIAQQVKQIVEANLGVLESFADIWQDGPPEDERAYLSVATPLQARSAPFRQLTGYRQITSFCTSPRSRATFRPWALI